MKEPDEGNSCQRDTGTPGNANEKVKGNSINFKRVNYCHSPVMFKALKEMPR